MGGDSTDWEEVPTGAGGPFAALRVNSGNGVILRFAQDDRWGRGGPFAALRVNSGNGEIPTVVESVGRTLSPSE